MSAIHDPVQYSGQQRASHARKLLVPVYRFTAGFDTADLVSAKRLLESLR